MNARLGSPGLDVGVRRHVGKDQDRQHEGVTAAVDALLEKVVQLQGSVPALLRRHRSLLLAGGGGQVPAPPLDQEDDWTPLANFLKGARLETGGGSGTLLVDAGAMLPGDNAPSGRRQEVEGAIKYIVQQAGNASN